MLDHAAALRIVEDFLRMPENRVVGDEWVVCEEKTIHGDFGWMFFYTTKRFRETGNWRYEAPGNAPLLLDAKGGLHTAAPGARTEATIFAFVRNPTQFRMQSLQACDSYLAFVRCPDCRSEAEVPFFAPSDGGPPRQFRTGEVTYRRSRHADAPTGLMVRSAESAADIVGIGLCPSCRKALWATIQIRSGHFESLKVAC